MSITIHQQPDNYSPVYNELPFVVTSTEEAQTNFKFVCNAYEGTTIIGADPLRTWVLPKHPTGGAVFDPSDVLKDNVSFDITGLQAGTAGFYAAANTGYEYSVQFIEQYGSPETYHASGAASGLVTFNGALSFFKKLNTAIADYILNLSTVTSFLTNSPRNIRIGASDSYQLGYMCSETSDSPVKADSYLQVDTYTSSGVFIQSCSIDNTLDLAVTRFNNVACGPADLNAATLATGSQPVIDDAVGSYTVRIFDTDQNARTETFTFTLDRTCNPYTSYRLFWMNPWGRFDAFNFKGYNKEKTKSERTESDYSRRPLGFKNGNAYQYSSARHSVYPFFTQSQDSIMLETDFITATERNWLKELMTSAVVFAVIDGDFWAMNVKTPADIDSRTQGPLNLSFEIEFAHKNKSQQR